MTSIPATSPQMSERLELARQIGVILLGLAAVVARRFLREPQLVGLTVVLWRKLTRVAGRIARAVARSARVRRDQVPAARARARTGSKPAGLVRLPAGRGWLVRALGYEAVAYGLQLQHVLTQPAGQAMLATVPAVAQILRPICRMLAVEVALAVELTPEAAAVVDVQKDCPARTVWPRAADPSIAAPVGECPGFARWA